MDERYLHDQVPHEGREGAVSGYEGLSFIQGWVVSVSQKLLLSLQNCGAVWVFARQYNNAPRVSGGLVRHLGAALWCLAGQGMRIIGLF